MGRALQGAIFLTIFAAGFFSPEAEAARTLAGCLADRLEEIREEYLESHGFPQDWRDRIPYANNRASYYSNKAMLFTNWQEFLKGINEDRHGQRWVIDGPPGSGESTLANAIANAWTDEGIAVIADFTMARSGGKVEAKHLAGMLADDIFDAFENLPDDVATAYRAKMDAGDSLGAFRDLVAHGKKSGKPVLFFIDYVNEVGPLLDAEGKKVFKDFLDTPDLNYVIPTSDPEIQKLLTGKVFHVQPESLSSVEQYIKRLTFNSGVSFTPNAIKALHEASGGLAGNINGILHELPHELKYDTVRWEDILEAQLHYLRESRNYDAMAAVEKALKNPPPIKLVNRFVEAGKATGTAETVPMEVVVALITGTQAEKKFAPDIKRLNEVLLNGRSPTGFGGMEAKYNFLRARLLEQYPALEDMGVRGLEGIDHAPDRMAFFTAWIDRIKKTYGTDRLTVFPHPN